MINFLKGKKTYISAILAVILAGLHATGHISDPTFETLGALAGASGLAALRSAVNN